MSRICRIFALSIALTIVMGMDDGASAQPKGGNKLPAWCNVTPTAVTIDKIGVIAKDKSATVVSAEYIEARKEKFGKLIVVMKVASSEASEIKVTTQPARSDVSLGSVGLSTDNGKTWKQLKGQDDKTELYSAKSLFDGGAATIGAEGALLRVSFTLEAGALAVGEPLKAKIVPKKGFNTVTVPNVGTVNTDMTFDKAEWTPPTADKAGTATLWLSTKNERSGVEIVSLNKGVAVKIVRICNDPKAEIEDWSELTAEGKNPKGNTVYGPRVGVKGRPVQTDAMAAGYIRVELELAKLPAKK